MEELTLLSPVTAPCRVVAQMTNFASHVRDAGMNTDTVPLTFFRKSSASISGPSDPIVKPSDVRFLDYEVEIGLLVGSDIPVGAFVTSVLNFVLVGLALFFIVKLNNKFRRESSTVSTNDLLTEIRDELRASRATPAKSRRTPAARTRK